MTKITFPERSGMSCWGLKLGAISVNNLIEIREQRMGFVILCVFYVLCYVCRVVATRSFPTDVRLSA